MVNVNSDLVAAISSVASAIVAVIAVLYGNRNTRKQIVIPKLEEIYELTHSISRYYGRLKELEIRVKELRSRDYDNIKTIAEYEVYRDKTLPFEERQQLLNKLSKLEALSRCYASSDLQQELLEYEDLIYTFLEFVTRTGSLKRELKWKNGFPTFEDAYAKLTQIQQSLVLKISN